MTTTNPPDDVVIEEFVVGFFHMPPEGFLGASTPSYTSEPFSNYDDAQTWGVWKLKELGETGLSRSTFVIEKRYKIGKAP